MYLDEVEIVLTTAAAAAKSLQSCPTLSDPMVCSLPGSSVHGIFQARVLEWGAIAFSNNSYTTHKWEIDGETVEMVSDFIFFGSKITADGDCSHEITSAYSLEEKSWPT